MRKSLVLVLLLTVILPFANVFAQDGGGVSKSLIELPEVDPLLVTGDIITAGSSTVFPVTARIAERFEEDGYADTITVDSIGTGAGLERFCVTGESDIANASRAIKEEELAACEAIDREVVEFRVGTDALAVVVSAENDFVTDLSLEQLAAIYSGTAKTWADVDASYPAEAIQLFSPGTDSGTFDFFVEFVMDKNEEAILAANPQTSEDDNVLVQGVLGSPYAIGYFGYAYYQENADSLHLLSIDGVTPSFETAENGDYGLSRPLYIYSAVNILTEKSQVADFISYYLTHVNEEIEAVGYFPASGTALDEAKTNWFVAMGMEVPEVVAVEAIELPAVDPLLVAGDIITAGSSTVFPVTARIAERFEEDGYADTITVDSIGTGAGLERFCVTGESDIANASRAIKEEELAACEALGREVLEFRVGTDALAVVVSAENDFVTDLSTEQLAAIYSGVAVTWADVDPSYPAEAIQLFSPGTDSGTFDFFVEFVLDKNEEAILAANPQTSEDDNVLVQGVLGSPYAIGYFGYAYYEENADSLHLLSIDGVTPGFDTAESGEYSLSRPLYIYSAVNILTEKPQVADFISYYLSHVNEEIEAVGYFPASVEALNEAKTNWLTAMGVTE